MVARKSKALGCVGWTGGQCWELGRERAVRSWKAAAAGGRQQGSVYKV